MIMSSCFQLELDTTPPVLNIQCPSKSIPNNVIEIVINSNEPLSDYQEIYMIDNEKNIHDLIFNKIDENTLVGYIDLQSYPIGSSQLHCRLKDEVLNLSNEAIHYMYIGYSNINDNYDAYVGCIEVTNKCSFIEKNIELNIIENNTKVEVLDSGTNWGYR